MPAVGELPPDFELLNQNGESVKLSDYRGKKVLLFAYPKAATPGCTTQACGFRDNFTRIETSDAVVLGLSPDEPAALAKWIKQESLPYDLLSDPEHQVLEAWLPGAKSPCMARRIWASSAHTGSSARMAR